MYLELAFSSTFSYGDVRPNGAKVSRTSYKSPVGFVLNAPLDRNGPEGFVMKNWDMCENTRLLKSFSLFCHGCRLGCENLWKIGSLSQDAHYLHGATTQVERRAPVCIQESDLKNLHPKGHCQISEDDLNARLQVTQLHQRILNIVVGDWCELAERAIARHED